MDPLFETATSIPTQADGYEWHFDEAAVRRFQDAVLLVPNASVRDRVRDGVNLLGGWHVLLDWGGDVAEDLPYVLQQKALRYMREILGASVRGEDSLPENPERYLRENGEALEAAWEERIAFEAEHR